MAGGTFERQTHRLGWEMIRQCGVSKAATLSPLSATIALAMVAGAATPDAEEKFHAKLGVGTRGQVQQSCQSLVPAQMKGDEAPLVVANAIFYEQDMKPTAEFAQYLEGFNVHAAQYPSLAGAVDEINSWVAQNTRDLIRDLLSREVLKDAGVTLINALAFKGQWKTQFDKSKTVTDHPFHSASGKTTSVPMMFQHNVKYYVGRSDKYTAVEMPYKAPSKGTEMSLTAYLPNEGTDLKQLIDELARNDAPAYKFVNVQKLGFPRFEIETGVELKDMLNDLGYPMNAAFPGVGGIIGQVIHRAIVKLDEEGTVAAAATAVSMPRGLAPAPNVLVFDRPFAFSIKIDHSDVVVFTGVYTKD